MGCGCNGGNQINQQSGGKHRCSKRCKHSMKRMKGGECPEGQSMDENGNCVKSGFFESLTNKAQEIVDEARTTATGLVDEARTTATGLVDKATEPESNVSIGGKGRRMRMRSARRSRSRSRSKSRSRNGGSHKTKSRGKGRSRARAGSKSRRSRRARTRNGGRRD